MTANTCDTSMTLPPVATRWQSNEVAQNYDQERFSSLLGRLFNYLSQRAFRRALKSVRNELDVVIDLPCGTGRATAVVRQFASRVMGADISTAMMTQAAKRLGKAGPLSFVATDVTHQPFPDNAIPCVTSIRFMMHLDQDSRRAALKEMARVSKRYVIIEYGYTTLWLKLRRAVKRLLLTLWGKKTTFVRAVAWNDITDDLTQANLELVRYYPTARGLSESVVLLLAKK